MCLSLQLRSGYKEKWPKKYHEFHNNFKRVQQFSFVLTLFFLEPERHSLSVTTI